MAVTHLRILLVEDNPGDARLVREMLGKASSIHFELVVVDRLALALETFIESNFDGILLDLSLPDSFGLDTVMRIRTASSSVPIVVMGSLSDEELAVKSLQAGAQDYLVKGSVDGPALVRSLRYAIERKRLENALAKSRDFYLTLFEGFPTLIWRAGVEAKCNYFNQSWLSFTGRTMEQEMGNGWTEGVHQEDLNRCLETYRNAFAGRRSFEVEYRLRRHDGEYRWIVDFGRPFCDIDGEFAGYIGSCRDITDRKQQQEKLTFLATHDPLTELPNRRVLEETLKRAVSRARRGRTSALVLIDVDNFKVVNDTMGHLVGDQALVRVAGLLQDQLRAEDLIARLGGDEFAVLLEGMNLSLGQGVAERMRRAVEKFGFVLNGHAFNLSLSLGLVAVDGNDEPDKALSLADGAMYEAKAQGRNRVVLAQLTDKSG